MTPDSPHGQSILRTAWRDAGEILGLSFPIIVAMASHTMMGVVDTWILAQFGADELAAGGAAAGVAFTFIALIFGTANCTSAFVAQSIGRGQPGECGRYTWQGIYFGLAVQALIFPFLVTPWAASRLMGLFGHEMRLQPLESVYLQIRLFHILGTAAYASLTSFFQGIGRPRVPMVAAVIANVFNAALDYVLVFGLVGLPRMGIAGAALATTIASYFQAGLLLLAFLGPEMHKRFKTRRHWRLDVGRLKRLLWVGLPAGLSFMLEVATWTIFTNVLIGRLGRDILAANNVTHQIIHVSFMPALGINKGITVIVGQYIGRRQIGLAKRKTYVAIGLTMAYMVCMGLCFVVFRRPLVQLFRSDEPIVAAGSTMLILAAIFQAFDAIGIVSYGALKGAGDTRVPAILSVSLSWGLLLPLGYLLTYTAGLGYVGAWAAAAIYIAVIGPVMFWRFASEAWRKIDIFEGRGARGEEARTADPTS